MAEDGKEYYLARSTMASARLTYQHHLLLARQGYLLHPEIVSFIGLDETGTQDQPPLEILDIATGNGIWLTELAYELSQKSKRQIKYTGLDISAALFPPEFSWPVNTAFATYDIFSDVPEEYIARFDVVHLRFLVAALWQDPSRGSTALNNMKRMLKPGGWLQWQDGPPPTIAMYDVNVDGTCTFHTELDPLLIETDNLTGFQTKVWWMNKLDAFVEGHGGFDHVQMQWLPIRPDRVKQEGDLSIWTMQEAMGPFMAISKGESEKVAQDWKESLEGMTNGTIRKALRSAVVIAQKTS